MISSSDLSNAASKITKALGKAMTAIESLNDNLEELNRSTSVRLSRQRRAVNPLDMSDDEIEEYQQTHKINLKNVLTETIQVHGKPIEYLGDDRLMNQLIDVLRAVNMNLEALHE